MTANNNGSDYFSALHSAEFMVLTTYRASGEAVPTTVWFAQAGERLFVTTNANLKKVTRIRAVPSVLVAASDRAGNLQGPPVEGRARVLDSQEFPAAVAALRAKYTAQYDSLTARMDQAAPPNSRIFIEITPP